MINECTLIAKNISHWVKNGHRFFKTPWNVAFRAHKTETQSEDIELTEEERLDKIKVRAFLVAPFEHTLIEEQLTLGVYEAIKNFVPQMHFGTDSMKRLF